MAFGTTDPILKLTDVTPFVECPHCRKLLEVEVTQCPECRELISREYAASSALVVAFNTMACGSAKNIRDRDPFIWLTLAGSIVFYTIDLYRYGYLFFFKFVLLWSGLAALLPLVWLLRFGRFPLGDDRFLQAKLEMQRSLTKWLGLLVLQTVALLTANY
jgi:RNA polymerase subunit RPABC4/transcription elongation factor Spt4